MAETKEKTTVVPYTSGNADVYLQNKLGNLKAYKEYRDKIDKFIKQNLIEGIDYGPPYEGSKKWTLLLPGAQKISRLLDLKPMFYPDIETWEMLGKNAGYVCYECFLMPYSKIDDAVDVLTSLGSTAEKVIVKLMCVSEGRGAGFLKSESSRLAENALVKKVQKRAFVDAVIRISDLSDKFTQDMDDLDDFPFGDEKSNKKGAKEVKETDLEELGDNELFLKDDKVIDFEVNEQGEAKAVTNPLASEERKPEPSEDEVDL